MRPAESAQPPLKEKKHNIHSNLNPTKKGQTSRTPAGVSTPDPL